ncbi:hypothetical protein LR48_Vigan07g194000 [Vigna angularis]|uniref:Phosphate-induced protein 1 n=1 Tax=Phaseolus angularis TaxID=3914 RepID=A0A0L9UZV5_PHAAN|nr:hypothetical protein LR48_Vigan07g194000 [Vigna angularis]
MNQTKGTLPSSKGTRDLSSCRHLVLLLSAPTLPLAGYPLSPPTSPLGQCKPTNQFPSISLPNRKRVITSITPLTPSPFYFTPSHYIYISSNTSLFHQPTFHFFLRQHKQMASLTSLSFLLSFFLAVSILPFSSARKLAESEPQLKFQYHRGPLLTGKISVNLIWYGKFKPSQKAILTDFITSLSSPKPVTPQPSVDTWWKATEKYYKTPSPKLALSLGSQILDENYSFGKSLTTDQIVKLASKGPQRNAINVVLTSSDVAVEGFCSSRCGTHGSSVGARINGKRYKFAYIWVGNSETQCPGQCAWPFHQPIYGPQSPALVAPNNDVGVDGMVINVASLLAGTVTNPFGNGYFQGPKEAPLEAASACTGVYGKGAYPA